MYKLRDIWLSFLLQSENKKMACTASWLESVAALVSGIIFDGCACKALLYIYTHIQTHNMPWVRGAITALHTTWGQFGAAAMLLVCIFGTCSQHFVVVDNGRRAQSGQRAQQYPLPWNTFLHLLGSL